MFSLALVFRPSRTLPGPKEDVFRPWIFSGQGHFSEMPFIVTQQIRSQDATCSSDIRTVQGVQAKDDVSSTLARRRTLDFLDPYSV